MNAIPQALKRPVTMLLVLQVAGLGWSDAAEDLSTRVAGAAPPGVAGLLPIGSDSWLGTEQGLKGGFEYGIGLGAVYDSNFFLDDQDEESELSMRVAPWVNYTSDPEGGAPFAITADYRPVFRHYMDNTELDGVDHSGGMAIEAVGAKTRVSAYINYSTLSGTDRFSREFVTGSVFDVGVRGSYQIAPRTLIYGNLRYAVSDYDSGDMVGAEIGTLEIGGLWSATERLGFGPALRYTRDQSDYTGTRETWALTMQARYLMGQRIQIIGSLGGEYANDSRESGGGDAGLVGGLMANYTFSERWSWQSALRYVTVPSPTEENFMLNNLAISTAISRHFLRADLTVGMQMDFSDYVEVGPAGEQPGSEDNLSAFVSYKRKLFTERIDFDATMRYTVNNGRDDWSQFQVSMGVAMGF